MALAAPRSFGAHLKSLREAAGFTQEELATIAGLSVHAISALERGERRRPHVETVRALSAALDLTPHIRDAFVASSRAAGDDAAVDELRNVPLPIPPTELVGREDDLRRLGEWLGDPAARLITLVGPGGVGKSRLALELARTLADEGSTRVVFVPLAAIDDAGLVACAIAEALGLADISAADLPGRARSACGGRPMLLALDNFEQVLTAATLVADLLASAPLLRLLVTSRTPLHVRGEREYVVDPLALVPDSGALSPDDLDRAPAVRLFVDRARDAHRDFRLTPANSGVLTAICRRLDALPLALELAAPWIKVLPPSELLQRLERDALLTTISPRDLPQRQQTMTATVAWSYQLLDSQEQHAFRRLGVLPARFPLDAAAAVLSGPVAVAPDSVLPTLARLIDKSLLVAEPSTGARPLYRMLETVRAYATQQLAASGERDEAVEGLVCYCLAEAAVCESGLVGPAQIEWLERVHQGIETHRTALIWLLERGRPDEAAEIAWRLIGFWMIRGYAVEARWWYQEVLSKAAVSPSAKARALVGTAMMSYTQGELARARTDTQQALELAPDDVSVVAPAEIMLGHVEYAAGNITAARDRFTNSVEIFRAAAIPWGEGNALTGLAGVAVASGDTAEAGRLLDEATTVLRQAGPWHLAWAFYWRAVLAVRRGDADRAIAIVRESLSLIRDLHDKSAFVHAMVPLSAAASLKGDHAWAARVLGAADIVTERTGAPVLDHAVRDLRANTEQNARAWLGPERWADAYGAGRTSSIDALLQDIDDRGADALVE